MGKILQGGNNLIYLIYWQYEQKQKKKYKSILKKKNWMGSRDKTLFKVGGSCRHFEVKLKFIAVT